MGSYVNYFMERKNGDVADDDPEFVPPMVGESEVIFTTFKAVPVRGRIRFICDGVTPRPLQCQFPSTLKKLRVKGATME